MEKGIIVIDMPSECRDCICCLFDDISSRHCGIDKNGRNVTIAGMNGRPDWCPIKPVHKKKSGMDLTKYDTDIHYEIGWNECLDEILKGE